MFTRSIGKTEWEDEATKASHECLYWQISRRSFCRSCTAVLWQDLADARCSILAVQEAMPGDGCIGRYRRVSSCQSRPQAVKVHLLAEFKPCTCNIIQPSRSNLVNPTATMSPKCIHATVAGARLAQKTCAQHREVEMLRTVARTQLFEGRDRSPTQNVPGHCGLESQDFEDHTTDTTELVWPCGESAIHQAVEFQ